MKKIMFNDRYNLEWMVLKGKKTQTRRVLHRRAQNFAESFGESHPEAVIKKYARFQVGEEVAIAQPYKNLIEQGYLCRESDGWVSEKYCTSPGYRNKMFVKAEYMPHRIRITGIKVERLQDISDEDCMAEGVVESPISVENMETHEVGNMAYVEVKKGKDGSAETIMRVCTSARLAYKALIKAINGEDVWIRNPYVFAYTFKLIK